MLRKLLIIVGSLIISFAAGAIGTLATIPNIPTWYTALAKPPFLPPNAVFAPVWALLYALMGIALALIILRRTTESKRNAYIWFGIQLVLNALWSLVFFGLHMPWLGVIVIAALIIAIIMTMRKFSRMYQPAMWLLVPYLAWVCFATYLTVGVAVLNP